MSKSEYEYLKAAVTSNFSNNVGRVITGDAAASILYSVERAYNIGVIDTTDEYSEKLSKILNTLSKTKGAIREQVNNVRKQDREWIDSFEYELEYLLAMLEKWTKEG